MRVRSGRFIAVRLMAGYALAAGSTSPGRVQRTAKVRSAPPCDCDVRSFSPCGPNMTSADFCTITARVAARRAVPLWMIAADSSLAAGSSPQRQDLDIPGWSDPGLSSVNRHRMRCRSPQARTRTVGAQAYRRRRTGGLCCRVPARLAALGLDYAISVRRLAPLALGLPPDKPSRTCPCRRLVVILPS